MKLFSKLAIAALSLSIGVVTPMRSFPVFAATNDKYISEVKVGIGKSEEEATSELLKEGYTILKENNTYADLNEEAGSDNVFAKGQKKVYLGYKTTSNSEDAITDLAVMNMRGGYSVKDYEVLMANRLKTQIIPFVDRFLVTLQEYRDNLNSPYESNKARAEYMRSMLNKLQDDDTGKVIGDLLINETKYELGDAAYNALSDEEKKNHADILTIVMQANGKSTLSMETLLTKASDASNNSWIDRLEDNSLDNLKELLGDDIDIADKDAALDRLYEDDATKLLEKWDAFSQALAEYDEKANALANLEESDISDQEAKLDQYDESGKDLNKNGEAIVAALEIRGDSEGNTLDLELVAAKDRLDEVDYDFEDGSTLAEFFAQDSSVFNGDGIRNLYPIVASLSAGQLAGLDFLSIQDLVTIAFSDVTSYESNDLGSVEPASIYEGVNREIFQKGKVALTNKALRVEAMKNDVVNDTPLSVNTYVLWGATAVATLSMIASWKVHSLFSKAYDVVVAKTNIKAWFEKYMESLTKWANKPSVIEYKQADFIKELVNRGVNKKIAQTIVENGFSREQAQSYLATKSDLTAYLSGAFTLAMVALAAYSIYSTIKEMIDYYKVEYTPIPKYIVDEADITEEVDGQKLVVRNDSAYYKVVECNRKSDAVFYEQLQNYADLNGDVGKQWLALYFVKFEGHAPIKADSLKVVKGSTSLPNGYSKGIHRFGEEAVFNLTSEYYCYNDTPKGTYVYYQVDESILKKASLAASNFSAGSAFLFGGIGLFIGAGIALGIMLFINKRKELK